MLRRMTVFLVMVGCAVMAMGATPSKLHSIKLNRYAKVGQKFLYSAKGNFFYSVLITLGQRQIRQQKEELTLNYKAKVTILAVNAKKQASKESHVIVRAMQTKAGKVSALLKPGTVVIVTKKGEKTSFVVGKSPLNKEKSRVLDYIMSLRDPRDPLDQELYGTKKPQAVGASWPVNGKSMAAYLSNKKMFVAPKALHGKVTLVKRDTINGQKGLHIGVKLHSNGMRMKLPRGFKFTHSKLAMDMKSFYPNNATLDYLLTEIQYNIDFQSSAFVRGQTMKMGIKAKIDWQMSRVYTK